MSLSGAQGPLVGRPKTEAFTGSLFSNDCIVGIKIYEIYVLIPPWEEAAGEKRAPLVCGHT